LYIGEGNRVKFIAGGKGFARFQEVSSKKMLKNSTLGVEISYTQLAKLLSFWRNFREARPMWALCYDEGKLK
jgi:hypothetical protein